MPSGLSAIVLVLSLVLVPAGATARPATTQRVLVRFVPGASSSETSALLTRLGARLTGQVYGMDVMTAEGQAISADALSARLTRSPLVDYAEPDHLLSVSMDAPDDPRYADQYALERISALAGWRSHPGSYAADGEAPTIAIIDTGIDPLHEDLTARIDFLNSTCFTGLLCLLVSFGDDHGHGTHVAGIAAAATDNSTGVAGVAYDSRIMAIKACDLFGDCAISAVAGAVLWARDRGAAVVNMSLGGPGDSATLRDAVRAAWEAGVILVAAAGNEGTPTKSYPASYPEVISVSATDSSDWPTTFSQYNDEVELSAPGVDVLSTYPTNRYRLMSGTSMATPHVAGLAALLVGQNPGWDHTQVRERMRVCANDLGPPGPDPSYGYGRINLERALGTC